MRTAAVKVRVTLPILDSTLIDHHMLRIIRAVPSRGCIRILVILILVVQCNRLLLTIANPLTIFRALIYVEFKSAFLDDAIWKYHLAVAVLNPPVPLSLIHTPVSPLHLAVSITLVLLILPFVLIARGPGEHAEPVFFVVEIVTFILIAWLRPLR